MIGLDGGNNQEDILGKLQKLVAYNIRRIRIENGVSQRDLAAWCNFEHSNMCRIEAGRTNLTLSSLSRIGTALGVDIRSFFEPYGGVLDTKSRH